MLRYRLIFAFTMRIFAFTLCCLIALATLFSGCKPMPNDGIPFYMKIDSVIVLDDNNQPAISQNVTDVWVEAGADNLGAYEMPARFPVLQEGTVPFVLSAGVWMSGQQNYRMVYPFYDIDTFTINAEREGDYSHVARFKYKPGLTYKINGDFETNSEFQDIDPISNDSVKYGTACGVLTVTALDSVDLGYTIDSFDLPEGHEIWLEFDYKTSVPFYVGFFGLMSTGETVKTPALFVNPRYEWRKVYLKLTEPINETRASVYKIYFEALRPVNTNGGNAYIDNVKLVYYP